MLMKSHFYSKFQHRRSSFKELQYICDGDSNGVLHFAGTSYGEHQWVNPVLSKVKLVTCSFCLDLVPLWDKTLICRLPCNYMFQKITITASSPLSRFTDPKVLVSRSYQVKLLSRLNQIYRLVHC